MSFMLMLSACGDRADPQAPQPRDPQVAQALDDPLMTDPDLSARNEAAAALTVEADGTFPVLPATPEAIAAARVEAAKLVGGAGRFISPPRPDGASPALRDRSVAAHLAALPGAARCSERPELSAIWAARLPEQLPVYPGGATVAAAGSDAAGCRVRVVGFTTPVPLGEVLAFYWTRAHAARLSPSHRMSGGDHVLAGRNAKLAFDLRANEVDGLTVVRLATLER